MKKRILLFCLLSLTAFYSHLVAQVTTVNISTDKDSYVLSSASTTNYGTDTKLYAGVNGSGNIRRSFVQFDLSSIPTNAIITSAKIYLESDGTYSSPLSPLSAERVLASWTETGITASNAPSVSTSGGVTIPGILNSHNYMTADVTSHVQNMVNYPALNFGWRIRLYTETAGHNVELYSSDYSISSFYPYLEISYVLPIVITADEIIHASSSTATDGEIHPTITEGDGTYTYNWIDGATGSSIGTSQNLTGVGYGWYGLEVTDGLGNKGYMSFIVGAECENISIYYNPGPNYIEDANVRDLIHGGINYGDLNEGNLSSISISRWTWSSWYNYEGLLKFNLILDDVLELAQADLLLYGDGHNPLQRANSSKLDKITSDWQELVVTKNTLPTSTAVDEVLLTGTTSTNQNDQIDLIDFWNAWQTNPDQNFGILMRLQDETTNLYTLREYYSSDESDTSLLPKMLFNLSINCRFAILNTTPNGAYYTFKGSYFDVKYNEEYLDVDGELNYEIIDQANLPVTLSQTIINVYGDNRIKFNVSSLSDGFYTLVITNDKKEKWYLRFKKGL